MITVLADLLGYEACGIELDPDLVESATQLAERFDSAAQFVCGSFVPPDYGDNPALESSDFLTTTDGAPAYEELGLDLEDFDLVYAFPWPDEEELLYDIVRCCARPGACMLTYHGTDGFRYGRAGAQVPELIPVDV